MTSAVLYRWRLKPGREQDFRKAWSEATKQIHKTCASHGACLHDAEDGTVWSYARWPSEDARQSCMNSHDWSQNDVFQTMRDCVEERFPETVLNVTGDQLDLRSGGIEVPLLTTARLVLRPMVLEDADSLTPALTDADNMNFWSRGPLEGVDEVRDYLRWNIDLANGQCFAVALKDQPGQAMGWVILMDRKPGEAEIGYMFRPDAQGQGYAREASARLLEHAFEVRRFRRVYADVDPDNKPSIGLLDALGFQFEGRARALWETHIGVRDSLIYSRLSTDEIPDN